MINYANEVVKSLGIDGAEVKEIEKANGIKMVGIVIPVEGSNMAPTIYINQMKENGLTPAEAATEVLRIYDNSKESSVDVDFITDFEKVKSMLRARLYNEKTKADVYKSANEYGFDDLIIVPYINLGKIGSTEGAVKVTSDLMATWGVTETEIIDIAIENLKEDGIIKTMAEILAGMMPEGMEMLTPLGGPQMYVISNTSKTFGAIQVIIQKDKLNEMFPSGYIVLPSSVHEVIVVPKDAGDLDFLSSMVNDVNASDVSPQEVLGTKAYEF